MDAELGLTGVRGVQIAASLSAFGVAVFWSVVVPPVLQAAGGATRDHIEASLQRLFRASLAVAIAAALIWLVAQAAFMAEAESLGDVAAAVWPVLTATHFGHVLGARLLLLMLSALAFGDGSKGGRRLLAALLAGVALTLHTWSTHAAAAEGIDHVILLGAESLHLLAAGAWLGSLAPLLMAVSALEPDQGARAARRFSPLGMLCVAVLAGAALGQSWILIGGLPGLIGTDYGRVALVKLTLLLVLLALAIANRFRYAPAMRGPASADAKRRLRRSIAVETAVGLIAVLAASLLANLPPAVHQQPVWPFTWRPSLENLSDPDVGPEVLGGLFAVGGAALLICVGLIWRTALVFALAIASVIVIWVTPDLALLFVQAYPTSFFQSPTGFAAATIVRGAELFPSHCAACHGASGKGDGPAAKSLPIPPADLTAHHLWAHSDGELFWWLSHGMEGPRGDLVMPGFADTLSENDRWALIDYVRAHNAGTAMAAAGQWPHPVPAPDFSAHCSNGRTVAMAGLGDKFARIMARDRQDATSAVAPSAPDVITITLERDSGADPTAESCVAADAAAWAAYAIVSGVEPDALAGTQFLVDLKGWLRARWRPGDPAGWTDLRGLQAAIENIRMHPIAANASPGHVRHH